jgi:hypothetical protein
MYSKFFSTIEKSREVVRSFKVEDQTEIEVINKYGNIHLIPWEEDSVRFEISLTVKGKKESKVEKNFEYIDFEFKANEYYVIAQTIFQGQGSFWSDVTDLANSLFSSTTATTIDYTVYFPQKNELKVENKFGNIYTTDHTAKVEINLSNGDLKAHAFKGDSRIRIEFGNANVDEIDRGKIFLNYAELTLEKSDFLDIESKSSKIRIREADDINIESRRDRFTIRSLQSIMGNASFSFIEIENVEDKVDLKTHYGDLTIDQMGEYFNYFAAEANYTDLILYLEKEKYYNIEITHNDKTDISFPAEVALKKESTVNEEEKIYKLELKIGELSRDNIPMNITAKSGKIFLNLQ